MSSGIPNENRSEENSHPSTAHSLFCVFLLTQLLQSHQAQNGLKLAFWRLNLGKNTTNMTISNLIKSNCMIHLNSVLPLIS